MVDMPLEGKPRFSYRMDMEAVGILMFFAILFDILGVIPFVNVVIASIAPLLIGGIFLLNGVSVWERKFLLTFIFCSFVEFIPFLSILPMYSAEAWYIVVMSRVADRALATASKAASKIVGEQAARSATALAYRGVATGNVPLKSPESLGQAYRQLTGAITEGARASIGAQSAKDLEENAPGNTFSKVRTALIDGIRGPMPKAANDNQKQENKRAA